MTFDIMQLLRGTPNMLTHTQQPVPNMLTGHSMPQQPDRRAVDLTKPDPRDNISLSGTGLGDPNPRGEGFLGKLGGFGETPIGQNIQNAMLGWAMGGNVQDSLGKGAQMVALGRQQQKEKKLQTANAQWLMKNGGHDENAAEAIAGNPQSLTAAIKAIYDARQPKYGFSTVGGDIIRYDERGNGPAQTIYDGPDATPMSAVERAR